jgi:hypothetical protein
MLSTDKSCSKLLVNSEQNENMNSLKTKSGIHSESGKLIMTNNLELNLYI